MTALKYIGTKKERNREAVNDDISNLENAINYINKYKEIN